MRKIWNIFTFLLILLSLFKSHSQSDSTIAKSTANLNDDITATIDVNVNYPKSLDIIIGLGRNFYFDTSFNDTETNYFDPSDIEEKTSSTTNIVYNWGIEKHKTACRLWKPKNDTLKLLCHIIDNITRGDSGIYLESFYINYKSYEIYVHASQTSKIALIYNRAWDPFLYADEQIIQIDEEKESYELRFKYAEYNNEDLYLYSNNAYLFLNNCSKNEMNLICGIKKEEIEERLYNPTQIFDLYYINSGRGFRKGDLIYNITIKDYLREKQDINVRITKLLQEYIHYNNFITYETNVKFISNLVSGRFLLPRDSKPATCYFKKDKDLPMIMLCDWDFTSGNNILGNIENEVIITNCSVKYNFKIQSVYNEEIFQVSGRGYLAFYSHTYTNILDFNSAEKFAITYIRKIDITSFDTKALRLFPDLDDLDCDYSSSINTCYVNRTYFENKKTGYYYTYHLISYYPYNEYSIYYEFSPIYVIIPEDNTIYIKIKKQENNITIGKNGTLFFKTNYNDNETNIFDDSEIEDIRFTTQINDINNTYYNVNCEIWKSSNKYISLICHLNQSLIYQKQQIILKEHKFNYKSYTIVIYSNVYTFVEQLNYTIPLLYSDNQNIIINEENNDYNLIFQIGAYNNEELFLYGTLNNFLKLESCDIHKKTINCKASKEKLEEILTLNNEQFKVMAINDEVGTIQLDYVGLITLCYNLTDKEDIYVEINKILINETEQGIPNAFETNITSIQNLNTYIFKDIGGYCYFKKTKINPLLLICVYQFGYSTNRKYLNEEMVLDNIHYKYNFRIQPYSINTYITVFEQGIGINTTDKEELNFISQNTNSIKFIVKNPLNINNVALVFSENPSSNLKSLNCLHLKGMIKCEVPIFHLMQQNYKDKNYVQVYHSNKNISLKIDYGIPQIKVILPEKIAGISIDIKENYDTKIICQNARFYLLTNYDSDDIFNSSHSDESTSFKTTITKTSQYNSTIYNVTCRLWKPKDMNIIIICEMDNELIFEKESDFQGYFNETIFYFNDYMIVISPDILLTFQIRNKICPFLYAEKQIINLNEDDELYDLKFKIDIYNNEPLLLSNMERNYINLNCSEENKILICKLEKEKLLEQKIEEIFKVYYLNEKYGFPELDLIFGVSINSNIQKEDIYVSILSLLQKGIEHYNYAPYETNITNISNVITNYFSIKTNREFNCFLKKSELNSLLLLCSINDMEDFYLGKIEQEIILNDIHTKYNFIILPVENSEIVSIKEFGSKVLFLYPQFIDLYLNKFVNIYLMMNFPENTKKIMLDSVSLDCSTSSSLATPRFKKCTAYKKDFKKTNDTQRLYIQHTNGDYSLMFYELSPIEIKFPQPNDIFLKINKEHNSKLSKIGKNGVLFFMTDYYDSENLFDLQDIENKTIFYPNITDENENKYNATCRLWKARTYNNTINIICNLNEDLKYPNQNIKLNDIIFEYKNYSINIISNTYISVNQINTTLSFLYSDKQNISIDYMDYKQYTKFTFNIESYNKDILFLYSSQDNYIILDDCIEYTNNTNKTLTCKILTSKLEEIITESTEQLYVGAINDNFGVYRFNGILPIEIISYYPQKIDIYISLKAQFSKNGIVGIPFGVETNITDYPNFITKKFSNDCYFKKVEGLNISYLCKVDSEQTYTIKSIKDQIHLNDIHWKYNFIIEPFDTAYEFNIKGNGSDIKLLYPELLNFSVNDNLVFRFIMPNPSLSKNIILNLDSPLLDCHDLDELKICNVSYIYFRGKQSGNYYPYYSYGKEMFIFGCSPIYVDISKIIELPIKDEGNPSIQYMGKDNIIYLVTQYIDKSHIFNDSVSFNLKFSNNRNGKIINGDCRLWNPNDEYTRLICKLNERFDNVEQIIYLNEESFIYNGYKIIFYNTARNITVKQLNSEIAFLYSLEQKRSIDDNIDSYTFNFKKELYHNELLILCKDKNKRIALNCNDGTEEIACHIKKDDLFQILSYNDEKFFISQIVDKIGILPIVSIADIIINYPNANQTLLKIQSLNLLTPLLEANSFIAYETDIINEKRITTNFFEIDTKVDINKIKCQLKTIQEKLLLLCLSNAPSRSTLNNMTETYLYDSSILYKFILYKDKNRVFYNITIYESSAIYSVYPEEIDFNNQDSFVIRYETDYPGNLTGIKLNNDSPFELECFDRIRIKECHVNQTHFTEDGEYYTYYQNHFGNKSISYGIPKIRVILKDKPEPEPEEESEKEDEKEGGEKESEKEGGEKEGGEKEGEGEGEGEKESKTIPTDTPPEPSKLSNAALIGIIVGSVAGGLIIIGLIIFFVLRWKKKKLENISLLTDNNGSNKIELMENKDN